MHLLPPYQGALKACLEALCCPCIQPVCSVTCMVQAGCDGANMVRAVCVAGVMGAVSSYCVALRRGGT